MPPEGETVKTRLFLDKNISTELLGFPICSSVWKNGLADSENLKPFFDFHEEELKLSAACMVLKKG